MFNCYQAVGMTCCTAGKGTREGEKASMHVSWNASYCGLSISCFADHKTIWIEFTCASLGFFEGICLFPFFKNNWSNVIEKKKKQKASLFPYIELNCKGLFSNFIPLHWPMFIYGNSGFYIPRNLVCISNLHPWLSCTWGFAQPSFHGACWSVRG